MEFHAGYRPEDIQPEHWSYENRLQARWRTGLEDISPDFESDGAVDLRPYTSSRHDQRRTSTCVAQAVVKALEIKRIMTYGREAHVDLSVLALYYLARELMSPPETDEDGGTYVSCATDALRRFGVCPESDWPFIEEQICESPGWRVMRRAYVHKIEAFYRIMSAGQERLDAVRENLRAGNPVVYGTLIGDSWFSYDGSGVLGPTRAYRGGHATTLVGYRSDGTFIGENSWGLGWGDNGFYYASPELIADIASRDFWVIEAGFEDW